MADPQDSTEEIPSNSFHLQSPIFGRVSVDFLVNGDVHPCPYLPDRNAQEEIFFATRFPPELYHDFMDQGFRRSGCLFYRPVCEECRECRAIRVSTTGFLPSKSQRRVLRKNQDLAITAQSPKFTMEKLRIFSDYTEFQHHRDPGDSQEEFLHSLYISPTMTLEFEYRLAGRLVAVSITDLCSRSLSSVYAYYDPDFCARSLGTLSALRETLFCQENNIPYYYIGFYIRDCPSMSYKARFRPYEILSPEYRWVRHELCGSQECAGRNSVGPDVPAGPN